MILYTFLIRLYQMLIAFFGLFNDKAKKATQGRKNWKKNQTNNSASKKGKLLWVHAASLGEFEQALPLIQHYKTLNYQILVSFFSPSGYELRKNHKDIDYAVYLPFDTPQNANDFLNIWQPDLIFMVKYEFWFHFLKAIQKRNIPAYLISGVFREDQLFYRPIIGPYFKKYLNSFTFFFLQDDNSAKHLKKLGYSNYIVSGDTRFDRVAQHLKEEKDLSTIKNFVQQDERKVLILGSSWPAEEKMCLAILPQIITKYKVIIAPHDISSNHLQQIQHWFKDYGVQLHSTATNKASDLLIIDHIGSLSYAYQYADIAFIGGAFGSGLHNILEAIIWGKPICFGPKHHKFNEAEKSIAFGLAKEIKNANELLNAIQETSLKGSDYYQNKALQFIEKNKNASQKIIKQIGL